MSALGYPKTSKRVGLCVLELTSPPLLTEKGVLDIFLLHNTEYFTEHSRERRILLALSYCRVRLTVTWVFAVAVGAYRMKQEAEGDHQSHTGL